MGNLELADDAYSLATDVSPERYRVVCPEARRFSRALSALLSVLGEDAMNPLWEAVVGTARAARWRSAAEGIPFNAPESGADEPLTLLMEAGRALDGLVEARQESALQKLLSCASKLRAENNEALAAAILATVRDGDPRDTCVVAVSRKNALALSGWLSGQSVGIPALMPREFMGGRRWDFAVVVGAGDWFPGQMFTCPRAEAITLVHYAHLRDSKKFWGIFGSFATVTLAVDVREDPTPVGEDDDEAPDELAAEQVPEPPWPALLQQAVAQSGPDEPTEERLPSRLVVLAQGFGLWLPIDAVRIRGLDLSAAKGERVVGLATASITKGIVLVTREGASVAGTLAAMADAELGARAPEIRQRQREWKESLRAKLRAVGAATFSRTLERAGARTTNVRYWASEDSIRPQQDHDFDVLLQLLGIADRARHLNDGRILWGAHHRAGIQLTTALEAVVDDADLSELEATGRQQLHLNDQNISATLTAFRVVAIQADTHPVAAAAARRPFKLKGAQWLE
jgi:hypothetical protein